MILIGATTGMAMKIHHYTIHIHTHILLSLEKDVPPTLTVNASRKRL
jgi:hypothetical protein